MADRAVPPVEEAASGLWRISLPIPGTPLPYVTIHALEVDGGVVLVDTGWPAPEVLEALQAGLAEAELSVEDVKGIVVSHIHPDHYGLAGEIRARSGAWIAMYPAEAALIGGNGKVERVVAEVVEWLADVGAPEATAAELDLAQAAVRRYIDVVFPDRLIADGERLELDGWTLRAIATPGHSPGHLCFELEGRSILLTGDHVLPFITPNVSFQPQTGPDPLGTFLESLERLRGLDVELALPCHGHQPVELDRRIDELVAHHEARLDEVVTLLLDGAETVWDVGSRMEWGIPWQGQTPFVRRSALGEAHAHLILLESRGRVGSSGERPIRWRLR